MEFVSIQSYLAAACYPADHVFRQQVNFVLNVLELMPTDTARGIANDLKEGMDQLEKELCKEESQKRKSN